MSKINFIPADSNQITKLPEEPSMLDTNDVGFATYVKGDKLKSGDPVDAVLLDIGAFENSKGVVVVRLLFGIVSGKSYDGIDVAGRTIAGDKNLSEAAAQYAINDLAIMGLVNTTDVDPEVGLVNKICDAAEKEKLLCTKMFRVSVEESTFKEQLQRRVSSITQPAAKLSKADMLTKLKGNLGAAIAKAKAGNKPSEKLPTSPPPANQRPATGDPFATPAPGHTVDPGAGDLGEL